jgi:hypothetical protein
MDKVQKPNDSKNIKVIHKQNVYQIQLKLLYIYVVLGQWSEVASIKSNKANITLYPEKNREKLNISFPYNETSERKYTWYQHEKGPHPIDLGGAQMIHAEFRNTQPDGSITPSK